MEKIFTIKEIAALYGVSTHLIRHYERLGLINPKRLDNNYSFFSSDDIYNLNIIRNLRGLNIPIKKIEDYLCKRNLEKTKTLITENIALMEQESLRIQEQLTILNKKVEMLQFLSKKQDVTNQIQFKNMEKRFMLKEDIRFTNEGEYETKLLRLYDSLHGAVNLYDTSYKGSIGQLNSKDFISYNSIFILDTENITSTLKYEMPAGVYACYVYKGPYSNAKTYVGEMIQEIKKLGYEPTRDIYEFYLVDFQETNDVNEYLTELQMLVKTY